MESTIKWQTGEPKERGSYLVTVEGTYETYVTCAFYNCMKGWSHWNKVLAWCLLDSIKPYKEET